MNTTVDFKALSSTILEAVKKSNVGVLGIATTLVGDTLQISHIQTESNRSDIDASNPLIIFKDAKNKKVTLAANAVASLRVVSLNAPTDFNAANELAGEKFATGLTQRDNFQFMKELIENLDGDFDVEKLRIKCVHRLGVPSANDPETPAMTAACYNGSTDYYEALGNAGGDQSMMQRAREDLHTSGVRESLKGKTQATDPKLFAWVPVFSVTMV
jgi:hypothetical protein